MESISPTPCRRFNDFSQRFRVDGFALAECNEIREALTGLVGKTQLQAW